MPSPCDTPGIARAMAALLRLYVYDDYVRILLFLASIDEPASIRRISRNTNIGHKTLARKLKELERTGLVEIAYERDNIRLYRATDSCMILRAVANGAC